VIIGNGEASWAMPTEGLSLFTAGLSRKVQMTDMRWHACGVT